MDDNQEFLTRDVALALLRRLSGCPGYPRFGEGEDRYVDYMIEHMNHHQQDDIGYARAVVDEFEGDFPPFEQFRAAAKVQAEICRSCHRPRWQHKNDRTKCRQGFLSPVADEATDEDLRNALEEIIPRIENVPWMVSFEVDGMKLAAGQNGEPRDEKIVAEYREKYPEAMAAIENRQELNAQVLHEVVDAFKERVPKPNTLRSISDIVADGGLKGGGL